MAMALTNELRTVGGSGSERRRHPRHGVALAVVENTAGATYFHRASNVSKRGIFLESTLPHPPGTRVTLRLGRLGGHAVTRLSGIVVARLDQAGMGVEFDALSPWQERSLERLIRKVRVLP